MGGAKPRWSSVSIVLTIPARCSVDLTAYRCCFPRRTSCDARSSARTGPYWHYRHPEPFHRHHSEGCQSGGDHDRRLCLRPEARLPGVLRMSISAANPTGFSYLSTCLVEPANKRLPTGQRGDGLCINGRHVPEEALIRIVAAEVRCNRSAIRSVMSAAGRDAADFPTVASLRGRRLRGFYGVKFPAEYSRELSNWKRRLRLVISAGLRMKTLPARMSMRLPIHSAPVAANAPRSASRWCGICTSTWTPMERPVSLRCGPPTRFPPRTQSSPHRLASTRFSGEWMALFPNSRRAP